MTAANFVQARFQFYGDGSETGSSTIGAVDADLTCTFGLPKIGQLLSPGAKFVGRLILVNVGFPDVLLLSLFVAYRYILAPRLGGHFQSHQFSVFDMAFDDGPHGGVQFEIRLPIPRPGRQEVDSLPIALH